MVPEVDMMWLAITDPEVMAMLQKSISAKLCPSVKGQACMDVLVNPLAAGKSNKDNKAKCYR